MRSLQTTRRDRYFSLSVEQSIGQHCVYGDAVLKEMLKDAFIFGINDIQIQRRLFQEKDDFNLQTAIEIATAIELSGKDASRLHANAATRQAVH